MPPSDNTDLENLLRQYRPAGPPPALRQQILSLSNPQPSLHLTPAWPVILFRSAIAALLLISFTLLHAANSLNLSTASHIGIGPIQWTPDAEAAADLLDSGVSGRHYIAMGLLAGNRNISQLQSPQN
jgi:hypothetical protein